MMKYKLGVIALAIGMMACTKKEKEAEPEVDKRAEFVEMAKSIRADTTLENNQLLAYVCENLFKTEYWGHKQNHTVEEFLEHVNLQQVNDDILVEINHHNMKENWNYKEVFILDSSFTTLQSTTLRGTRYQQGIIEIEDFDGDGIEDLKYLLTVHATSIGVVDEMEMIYQYSDEKVLSKTFEIMNERRNCSSVMHDKWNYVARSYSFTSDHVITVSEGYYLIDCEEYERLGKISKLRTIKRDSYTLSWNDSKGMFVKDYHL